LSHLATATIRDLRNRFPEIKKIVESEGEVILTDRGKPKYRLTPLVQSKSRKRLAVKDYMERLRR
jgi:prevent-host-death family protein